MDQCLVTNPLVWMLLMSEERREEMEWIELMMGVGSSVIGVMDSDVVVDDGFWN
jgi:hypothetical protein